MKKKNLIKKASVLSMSLVMLTSSIAFGHGGRTDGSEGHKDNKNASGLGSYHYHCGSNPPHLHSNGGCPCSSSSKTSSNTKAASSSSNSSANIKAVQTKLNSLGYDCGIPDGVAGVKTKNAIKAFQKNKKLTADGIAGPATRKALGL